MSASLFSAFSRQDNHPTGAESAIGNQQPLTQVTRSSCYLSILPVGAIVLLPQGNAGCTCGLLYPDQPGSVRTDSKGMKGRAVAS